MSLIHGKKFVQALLDAGVVRSEDHVRRVVIDASYDGAVVMYVERYGDERLLQVVTSLDGVQIRERARKAGRSVWHCECHPSAQWGHFADYPDCPIGDLNYGDPASTTYGIAYRSLDELQVHHVGVRSVESR